jgi:hypothetical protein
MEQKYWILGSYVGCYPSDADARSEFFNPLRQADESLRWLIENNENYKEYCVPPPLEYEVEIDKSYGDHFDAAYYPGMSLMRDDLIEVILSVGVKNIETFETIITDTISGQQFTNFKYVHIIGETEILEANKTMTGIGGGDTGFPDIVQSGGFADLNGLHIARLTGHQDIVIDRVIREAIEKASIGNEGLENIRYKKRYSIFDDKEDFD